MTTEYIVIEQSVLLGEHTNNQVVIDYGWDGCRFPDYETARRHGFESRDSDDFNIATVEGDVLTGWFWMREPLDDPEAIREICRQNELTPSPELLAPPGEASTEGGGA